MDRNVTLTLEKSCLGRPITCRITRLDEGYHVLLTGGHSTHVGAVSTCRPGEEPDTRFFPGHKDQHISGPWAAALAEKTGQPVCVVCGIHYDDATAEDIENILAITDKLLGKLIFVL